MGNKNIVWVILSFFSCMGVRAELNMQYFLDVQNVDEGVQPGTGAQGNLFLIYSKEYADYFYKGSIIATHGESPAKLVGDAQTTSNLDIASVETIKLFELLFGKTWNKLTLVGGMLDLSSDFNVNEPAAFFIHSSPGTSAELAAAGKAGAAFNPYSALGMGADFRTNNQISFKWRVMDALPFDAEMPHESQLTVTKEDGLFYISEITYEDKGKTKFGMGYWYFNELPDKGFYLDTDHAFNAKFHPFLRYGEAMDHSLGFARNFVAGFVSNQIGMMYSRLEFDNEEADLLAEDAYEISYALKYQAIDLKPNIQLIKNPSGRDDIEKAYVYGLRVAFEISR